MQTKYTGNDKQTKLTLDKMNLNFFELTYLTVSKEIVKTSFKFICAQEYA